MKTMNTTKSLAMSCLDHRTMAAFLLTTLAGATTSYAQQQAPYVPIPSDTPFRGTVVVGCGDAFEERVDQIAYDNSFSSFGETNPELVGIGSTNVMDDILFPAWFAVEEPRLINSVRVGVYVPTAQSGDFDVVLTAWPTLNFSANPMVSEQPLGSVRVPVSSLGNGVWELTMTGIGGPCGNLSFVNAANPGRIGLQVAFTQPDSEQLMPFPSAGTGVQTVVPIFARGQATPVGSSMNSYASDDNGDQVFQGGNPPLVGNAGGPHEHRVVSNATQTQDLMVRLDGAIEGPLTELIVTATDLGNCCYSFDVLQHWGDPGHITTISMTLPPGAVVSSASNGNMPGAGPVISGGTVTWTMPAGGLTPRWFNNFTPEFTLQVCFAALPSGSVVQFHGSPNTWRLTEPFVSLNNATACGPVDCQCPANYNSVVTTLTAGVADAYSNANASETSMPDPLLDAWMRSTVNPPGAGFDDPTQNRKFGHTFTGLPPNIQCATLEIRMKAGNTIPCTDSLSLGFNGGASPFVWGIGLPTLDGGNWNPGEDRTFVLDLGNLSGGGNLLPFMNGSNHSLDVYVQDDTMVDYVTLRVKTCEPIDPCDCPVGQTRQSATVTAGTPDGFGSGPDAPATPRAPFLTYLNANPNAVTGFDQTVANRVFGHTFSNLPSTITCAQLEIMLKPIVDASTDSLSLGFQPATNNFAWGISLPALYGGNPPVGSPMIFIFDLSNVNNSGTSLINFMNAGVLDVYVQDDTAVDYMILTYEYCDAGCDSIDFNNDTSFFDPQDIDAFLSVYSEGPCIPDTATCNDIDFNNDGSVFDPCDIDSFLLQFSEGPCTLCGQ